MIRLSHVGKSFAGHRAVDDVSFVVETGEVCALVGTSGSGKSTTLRLINRLISLDEGTIEIGGVDIASLDPVVLRRRLGYVIQSIGLFPHWTVARNVGTVPALLGWPAARIADRVEALLELVELDPSSFGHRYPHQLSGGQQQRVGVARALAADPEVLLMDEPFGALDPVTRGTLQDGLKRIHAATGKTIVIVTHDVEEAIQLADRIAVLDHGRLVQYGSPRDLLRRPANAFVADFMGGDRIGLRRLKVDVVGAIVRPGEQVAGPALSPDATLDDALAAMLSHRLAALPVVDERGGPVGAVYVDDIVARS
jgi:osmoprotectant transport system ATP-binding protein